jgi:mxaJ protein
MRKLILCAALLAGAQVAAVEPARVLRVCADPDNLPYSHADESGFENRIARLLADELHATLRYAWQPQGRGFVRKTLGAGLCDVLIGMPTGFERVLTTRPYYRSGYVFVNRADAARPLDSFDDPRLATLSIGVQLIGDDLVATPPGYALARHGATQRVVGYPVYGDGPAAQRATADLASGQLDAALLWGPQAGYFATHSAVPLQLCPAQPPADVGLPFEFSISMGVRKTDYALRQDLDAAIAARSADIAAILDAYAVPRMPLATAAAPAQRAAAAASDER